MGSVLGIAIVICEYLEYFSIKYVTRSLATMGNNVFNTAGSWSTPLRSSFTILAKCLAFFALALISQSGSENALHRTGFGLLAHNQIYNQKQELFHNSKQNSKQNRK